MITNLSRIDAFQKCRRYAYNWAQLGLMPQREAEPLILGGAAHEGLAEFLAHRDPNKAVALVETTYRERIKNEVILPEERPAIEQSIEVAKRLVRKFCDNYSDTEMQVIWPEVEFLVPLPNTNHHCWFFHQILYPHIPFEQCANQNLSFPPANCWQPHYFRGKTDAVISWKGAIWLLEHKTTSYTGDIFYDRFWLDFQPTGYLYGIGKAMGTTPHGFVLNVLKKPTKNKRDQLDVGYEREFYLRTEEDLKRFEKQLIRQCDDYEKAFMMETFNPGEEYCYMNTKSCTAWNRRCYYWANCKRNEPMIDGDEFRKRDPDYVDKTYYEILGLPVPGGTPLILSNDETNTIQEV